MMIQSSTHILHVDDEPEFGDLTATFLERENDRFTVETATSAADGLESIRDSPPDCIVSDYDMPGQDGIEFLQSVREEFPNLPFILFTGKGGEEVASEAISAGVTDYLQKGSGTEKYELLANRVENSVHAKRERQRADRQEQLMRLTEIAGDTGGFEIDLETEEVLMTEGTRRLVGLPDADISLEEAIEMYHPEDQKDVRRTVDRAAETGKQTRGSLRLQPDDGDERILDITITPVVESGEVRKLRGAAHDITERKEREQRLIRRKDLMSDIEELADVGAWEYDPETDEIKTTDGTRRIRGLDPGKELTVKEAFDFFHPEDRKRLRDRFEECLEKGEPYEMDVRVVTPEDEQKWVTARGERVDTNGNGSVVRGYLQDITERKEREQELREQKEFTQQALDALYDVFYVLDTDGTVQRWNQQVIEMTGYDIEELDGMAAIELFPEDDQQKIADGIEKTLEEGEATVEADLLNNDGQRIPHEWSGARLTDMDGDTTGLVGVGRDITQRRRREHRFRALVKESNDIISIVDADGRIQYQSPSVERVLGYDPEETVGDVAFEYIHPEDREAARSWFEKNVATGEATEPVEYRARHADGSWRWVEAHGNNQLSNPAIEGYVINSRDITEQKRRNRKLENVETFFENTQDSLFLIGVGEDFTLERVNPAYEEVTGMSAEDICGRTLRDTFGQDGAEMEKRYAECVEKEEPIEYEEQIQLDGGLTYWETRIAPVVLNGEVEYIAGSTRNITERKRREEKLKRTQERLDLTVEAAGLGLWDWNTESGEVEHNEQWAEMFGLPPEEGTVSIESIRERSHPNQASELEELIEEVITGKRDRYEIKLRLKTADGDWKWIRTVGQVSERDGKGEAKRLVGVNIDINELKRKKEDLERYRTFVESSPDVITHLGVDGEILYQSPSVKEIGYYQDESVGDNAFEYVHPDDRERVQREFFSVLEDPEKDSGMVEYRVLNGEGEYMWTEATGKDQRGTEAGGIVISQRDITERKRRERKLERQKERLEEFASVVSHDLRNPLSVAKGRLELAQQDCDSRHLGDVDDALDRMDTLIEDILTLAREGSDVGEMETVETEEVIEDCWSNVETENATLVTEIKRTIQADPSRLKQLCENLVRNAVEHGSTGSRTESDDAVEHGGEDVTVTVGELEDREGFYIADDGEGIPEEKHDEVFETGYSTAEEGTGFGLRIVEQIAEAHGWEIQVVESDDGGARFEVTGVDRIQPSSP